MRMLVIAVALVSIVVPALGQGRTHTPAPGSAERKAILDALRKPVERNLGQDVLFKIDHFKVSGEWAFVRGVPQQPGGQPIDYSRTEYREAIEAGAFDDGFCALLERRAGKWTVVTYVIGATDVAWDGWWDEYGAPKAIFE